MEKMKESIDSSLYSQALDAKNDMGDMQEKLAKLRGLASDDKTEAAMLRSRIDEQSQLIMILKQRADEASLSIHTLERINKELETFRDNAQQDIQAQIRKYDMLDRRFTDLAENHAELIQIKDEYKRVNEELRRENFKLRDDNERLFSKAIEDKDKKILELDKKFGSLREQYTTLDARHKELQASSKCNEEKSTAEIKDLKHRLNETEERLKGATAKLKHQQESRQTLDAETQAKMQALVKEKDDMLNLAMSRGKLIADKGAENKKLEQKIQQLEKTIKENDARYERDAAAVNVNLQVRKLKQDLEATEHDYKEITREFEAFKKHSNSLLKKEQDLNTKLRQLVG